MVVFLVILSRCEEELNICIKRRYSNVRSGQREFLQLRKSDNVHFSGGSLQFSVLTKTWLAS